jgi:hypothetical protein
MVSSSFTCPDRDENFYNMQQNFHFLAIWLCFKIYCPQNFQIRFKANYFFELYLILNHKIMNNYDKSESLLILVGVKILIE